MIDSQALTTCLTGPQAHLVTAAETLERESCVVFSLATSPELSASATEVKGATTGSPNREYRKH